MVGTVTTCVISSARSQATPSTTIAKAPALSKARASAGPRFRSTDERPFVLKPPSTFAPEAAGRHDQPIAFPNRCSCRLHQPKLRPDATTSAIFQADERAWQSLATSMRVHVIGRYPASSSSSRHFRSVCHSYEYYIELLAAFVLILANTICCRCKFCKSRKTYEAKKDFCRRKATPLARKPWH